MRIAFVRMRKKNVMTILNMEKKRRMKKMERKNKKNYNMETRIKVMTAFSLNSNLQQ